MAYHLTHERGYVRISSGHCCRGSSRLNCRGPSAGTVLGPCKSRRLCHRDMRRRERRKGKKKMGKTAKESPTLPPAGTNPGPPPKRGYVPGQLWERLACMDAAVARPSCSTRRISSMTGRENTATARRSKAMVARRGSSPPPPLFGNVLGMQRGHIGNGSHWWTHFGGGRHPAFRPLNQPGDLTSIHK